MYDAQHILNYNDVELWAPRSSNPSLQHVYIVMMDNFEAITPLRRFQQRRWRNSMPWYYVSLEGRRLYPNQQNSILWTLVHCVQPKMHRSLQKWNRWVDLEGWSVYGHWWSGGDRWRHHRCWVGLRPSLGLPLRCRRRFRYNTLNAVHVSGVWDRWHCSMESTSVHMTSRSTHIAQAVIYLA